jgi:hypothetical protein
MKALPVVGDIGKAPVFKNRSQGWGLNRYLTFMGAVSTASVAANTAAQFVQDVHNDDPNKFERLGLGLGGLTSEGMFLGGAMLGAWDQWRQNGLPEAVLKDGTVHAGAHSAIKGGKKGVLNTKSGLRGGSFIKTNTFIRDTLMFTAAPILAGMAVGALGSMAGRFIDNRIREQKQGSQLNYDNRFFDTRKYDQQTYNQVSRAMEDYADRMVSVARIHHSR